uniref:RNA polymerase alpha subunit n=1 Tax=Cutleria multifida TaxID=74475 RepID=UPI002E75AFCD|nr:RNA polymerase alpha subunit [Cutleria multifida]WAM62573.1 RNA polymerase alpha subunit [Cutleria multifida]
MQINSKCKWVDLDLLNPNEFYGHFVFTSLEKGEGTTIGNMLRRTLLSNLYGSRIVGVRLPGINNEFTPLEGVREDVLEIILNLKEIIILNEDRTGQSCYGRLKAYGPGIITAGSLILPNNVKIVNPNSHLLTISDDSLIELEVKIEFGKSYVLAKEQKLEGAVGFIPIDSNFAPVLKVNWYIKPLPQDIENNNEELHLEIFTNGTLSPHQALIQARNIIGYMLSPIKNMEVPYFNFVKQHKKDLEGKKELILEQNKILNQRKKELLTSKKSISLERKEELASKNTQVNSINKKKRLTKKSLNSEPIGDKAILIKGIPAKKNLKDNKITTAEERLLQRVADMESGSLKGLGLSNRIINALNKVNINFTWDLMKYPSPNLINIEGLGPKSVEEINNKLDLFYEPPIN